MTERQPYPLPAYAQHYSRSDIGWRYPWMVLFRPTFLVCAAIVYLLGVYFAWEWLADSATLRSFAWTMAQWKASIDGLPPEARHLPVEASRIQLSVLHFICAAFFIWRVVTLKPAVWLLMPTWRFVGMLLLAVFAFLASSFWFLLLWQGGVSEGGLDSMHDVVIGVYIQWFFWTVTASLGLSAFYELRRRSREGLE